MGLGKFKSLMALKNLQGLSPAVSPGLSPPIAVDFGAGALKVLQLSSVDPPTLAAAACVETPDLLLTNPLKRLEFQIALLPKIIREGGFRGKRAVCTIPVQFSFTKHVQVQVTPGVPTSELVCAAMGAVVGCDPSLLLCRHTEVGASQQAGKTECIGMATSRELVSKLMGAIRAAKLDPVGMHSEFHAMIRAFDHLTKRAEDVAMASLYLDIGYATTKIAIAHGRDLVFARSVEMAARHFDQAVAGAFKVDLMEGRRLRRAEAPEAVLVGAAAGPSVNTAGVLDRRHQVEPGLATEGLSPVGPEGADLTEAIEMVADEIRLSIRYHEALFQGRKIDRIIFVGGEGRARGVCQRIARALEAPAQIGDPLARVARTGAEPCMNVDLKKPQPGWATALGLCLCPTDL